MIEDQAEEPEIVSQRVNAPQTNEQTAQGEDEFGNACAMNQKNANLPDDFAHDLSQDDGMAFAPGKQELEDVQGEQDL